MHKYKKVRVNIDDPSVYEKGDKVYLANINDSRADGFFQRSRWIQAQKTMFTKNLSGEETLNGWCGSTRGVSVTAINAGTVIRNLGIIENGSEAYISLKVRVNTEMKVSKVEDSTGTWLNVYEICNCCGALAALEFEEGGEWHTLCEKCEIATRPEEGGCSDCD